MGYRREEGLVYLWWIRQIYHLFKKLLGPSHSACSECDDILYTIFYRKRPCEHFTFMVSPSIHARHIPRRYI